MSMTQEEIEALMNDTSIAAPEEDQPQESSLDDILDGIDGIIEDGTPTPSDENIDAIATEVATDDQPADSIEDIQNSDSDIEDILAGIDNITDGDTEPQSEEIVSENKDEDIGEQIDQGVYPLPVSNEHQVVNQLNEVAEDSEEKASQIFDVLSYILDENDKIQKEITDIQKFIDDQTKLLETLGQKFPNISIFLENLEEAQNIRSKSDEIGNIIDAENGKVFEAMELMQYHDINRQKIERVMAVIRKLANYLNGIFSDDSSKPEVQIAKHISGDGRDTVSDDDLDSLIAEFNH